jgi:peptide/nickel transport system substrate-binding protein
MAMRKSFGATMMFLLAALAACTPAAPSATPAAPAPPGDVRDENQNLRAAVAGLPANLTPQISASAFYVFWPFYDNLTQFGPNFEPKPAVAEKWDLSADGMTWTFTIRKDMKFTDGSPLTAEDVAFTFSQIVNAGWPQRSFFPTVTGARATSDTTVDVTTRSVDVSVPAGGPYFWVVPKKHFEAVGGLEGFRDKPMGSGPYEVVTFRPGDTIQFRKKATPHPYRQPIANEILLRAIPEPIQLINGLRPASWISCRSPT